MKNNKNAYFDIFKGVLFHPAKTFHDIESPGFEVAIYVIFGICCFVTFLKSFLGEKVNSRFFENEIIDNIISFLTIPQIQLVVALLCYTLFIFVLCKVSNLFSQSNGEKKLILCLLSISSVGLLLHIIFYIVHFAFSIETMNILRRFSFFWVFCLSILAIKEIKNLSYLKSLGVFLVSGFPSVIIVGLPGLAPYLLWLVFSV